MNKDQKPDHFANKAGEWDKGKTRVMNALNISKEILKNIALKGTEHLMDFGAGTGLLSQGLADRVQKITAIDYSEAMLQKFMSKSWPCETEILNIDLTEANLDFSFDGIISSMTLHHIEDIPNIFGKFHALLKAGGFVALADLEKEDGSFHSNNTGVSHFGFEEDYLRKILLSLGFSRINFTTVNVITKEAGKAMKDFPIFLVTAYR